MNHVVAYRYRWVVLLTLILLTVCVESQWLVLAPVSRAASAYYADVWPYRFPLGDLMSVIYMGVFVLFAWPVALMISKVGIVRSLRRSVVLIIIGSIAKASYPHSATAALVGQLFFAFAHVIVLDMQTVTVARWFPIRERGMAMGLLSSARYITLAAVLIFTPYFVSWSFPRMLQIYGAFSVITAFVSAFLIRENPPSPSSLVEPAKNIAFDPLHPKTGKSLAGITLIFSVFWGVLMSVLIKIDGVAAEMHVQNVSYLALTLTLCGAGGAIILPVISDATRKRKLWFVLSLGFSLLGILVIALSPDEKTTYIGTGIFGFFSFSAIPIGLQYAVEIGYPAQEEKIQARMMLFAQAVCALIVLATELPVIISISYSLGFFIALVVACFAGSLFLSESPMIVTEDERLGKEIDREIVQNE